MLRPNSFIQLSPDDPYSTRLPKELKDGDEAMWQIPVEHFGLNMEQFFHGWFAKYFPAAYIRTLKVGVSTSTGVSAEALAEKPLRDWCLAKYRESKKGPKGDGPHV